MKTEENQTSKGFLLRMIVEKRKERQEKQSMLKDAKGVGWGDEKWYLLRVR